MKSDQNSIILFTTIIWVSLSAFVTISGKSAFWGLMPSELVSAVWIVPVYIICIAILFSRLVGKSEYLTRSMPTIPLKRHWSFTMAGLALIVLIAWLLRSQNHFLGDGWEFIGGVKEDFSLHHNEPLDFFIHQLYFRIISYIGVGKGEYAYSTLSVILLAPYLIILWKITKHIAPNKAESLPVFTLLCSTSALQLFFGYVESYTLVNFCIAAFLLSGLWHLEQKQKRLPLVSILLLVLAVALHLSAVVLLPTVVVLILPSIGSRESSTDRFVQKIAGAGSLILFFVCGFLFLLISLYYHNDLLVPYSTSVDHPFTLFSVQNLWYKLNFVIFSAPIAIVAFLLIPFNRADFFYKRDNKLVFIFWAALSSLSLVFVFDPLLGIRDWDIFALCGLPVTVLATWILLHLLSNPVRKLVITSLALTAFAHVATFIWTNSLEQRGLGFLVRTASVDLHKESNHITLGFMLQEHGYPSEALTILSYTEGERRKEADFFKGMIFNHSNLPDSAITYLKQSLKTVDNLQDKLRILMHLVIAYDMIGDTEKASHYYIDFLEREHELDQANMSYWRYKLLYIEKRNRYLLRKEEISKDTFLLKFYLRYHTILSNTNGLANCYQQIIRGVFSAEDWTQFILIARYTTSEYVYNNLIKAASIQHPLQTGHFMNLAR